jgi:peptide/nickel transport system ATP-binding protein
VSVAVPGSATHEDALLRVSHLVVDYPVSRRGRVQAVSDVSFDVHRAETLALVGESGCGKTTVGRSIVMAPPPTAGSITFDGTELTTLPRDGLRRLRPKLQMIFQDPISSLNPRRKVRDIVAEGLRIWPGAVDERRVDEVMEAVGLRADLVGDRRPGQFSGGQCQRISIARALLLQPELIICDEPVSSLDVSIQAQILNLLREMKDRYQLTLLFISHDLAVVKNLSDRVAVMYLGRLCEIGSARSLFGDPGHPYTQALLEAVPIPDPRASRLPMQIVGEPPSPLDPPSGCRFRTRCPRAQALCATEEPAMQRYADHQVACHFPGPAEGTSTTAAPQVSMPRPPKRLP